MDRRNRHFEEYRPHGAPIGIAPDPLTVHECGDSRYLAIPFSMRVWPCDCRIKVPGTKASSLST